MAIPTQELGTWTIKADVRFGDLLTASEMNTVEGMKEPPLITLYSDRIWIAYDRAEFYIEIPIQRRGEG